MNRPRASRLSQPQDQPTGIISRFLPESRRIRIIIIAVIIPVIIVFIIGLIGDKVIMPIVTRQDSAFPLPDFVNQRLVETQMSISDLELRYEISSEEYSPGKPQGVILRQFPRAGAKVKPGRSVKFVVSLGQKLVAIPDLSGRSVRQAMLDLETYGLVLGEITMAYSDTIPERVVVFSYPAAGTDIPIGAPVNLMVNRGRASNFTYVPKIIGMTIDEATKLLEDKLLKVGLVSYRIDENYLPETVLEQSEPEGVELDLGTEIDLVISSNELPE